MDVSALHCLAAAAARCQWKRAPITNALSVVLCLRAQVGKCPGKAFWLIIQECTQAQPNRSGTQEMLLMSEEGRAAHIDGGPRRQQARVLDEDVCAAARCTCIAAVKVPPSREVPSRQQRV